MGADEIFNGGAEVVVGVTGGGFPHNDEIGAVASILTSDDARDVDVGGGAVKAHILLGVPGGLVHEIPLRKQGSQGGPLLGGQGDGLLLDDAIGVIVGQDVLVVQMVEVQRPAAILLQEQVIDVEAVVGLVVPHDIEGHALHTADKGPVFLVRRAHQGGMGDVDVVAGTVIVLPL